jgi:hypothetical protein
VVVVRMTKVVLVVLVARAVQALSFFATPAQFNISLVAQFPPIAGMSYIHLHRLEHWLQQHQVL